MSIIIEIIKAIFFGIIEGITEWLPVSSTGHMIILQDLISLDISPEFWKMFEVVIQLGAIMAVVILFWKRLWPLRKKEGRVIIKKGTISLWIKIVIACIPAAIVGIIFDDEIDELFYHPIPVALALIVVGILFIIVEGKFDKPVPKFEKLSQITIKEAFLIGLFQLLAAIFPGTSRSGATIIGGLLLGLSRKLATTFTFFLAVPVMFGASLLKIVKYIFSVGFAFKGVEIFILIIATLVAFFVSLYVIGFLMNYVRKHDFKVFGWYRVALGMVIIIYTVMK